MTGCETMIIMAARDKLVVSLCVNLPSFTWKTILDHVSKLCSNSLSARIMSKCIIIIMINFVKNIKIVSCKSISNISFMYNCHDWEHVDRLLILHVLLMLTSIPNIRCSLCWFEINLFLSACFLPVSSTKRIAFMILKPCNHHILTTIA